MKIEQFFDKDIAHLSYAILSEGEIALIDPARDATQYHEFAKSKKAKIVAVIETHPHADFISSHAELGKTGVKIYISKLTGVSYSHISFDEGEEIKIGKVTLKALNTPGHSPDSISIVLYDEHNKEHAVFTGDTLFIGDVGRPDLRESVGNTTSKKELLAKELYHSLRDKLMPLPDATIVYPAHGPGSLCGKSMSAELSATLGEQKSENYALQPMEEAEFVKLLMENQPAIPKYFPYNVELNRKGAPSLNESLNAVKILSSEKEIKVENVIIDTRTQNIFKTGHLPGAINIQNGGKFETWLGSVVEPEEKFYLVAANKTELDHVIRKTAKIGYELNIIGALAQEKFDKILKPQINLEDFKNDTENFTIIDVREESEVTASKPFPSSIHIPLGELRERKNEVPQGKPIVVHCAGGYRSAIGSSILSSDSKKPVYDLSDHIKEFEKVKQE